MQLASVVFKLCFAIWYFAREFSTCIASHCGAAAPCHAGSGVKEPLGLQQTAA